MALKERFNVIQRKMVRFIFSLDYRAHVDVTNLRELAWLTVPDRVKFFKLNHLFRIRHKLAPTYLLPNFKLISAAHSYNTRGSSHNFHVSKELSLFPNGFAYTAIKHLVQVVSVKNKKNSAFPARSVKICIRVL